MFFLFSYIGHILICSSLSLNQFLKSTILVSFFHVCLQSASDISDDVTPYNIISKLSLLVLHFPRLRILWSRSLHATAEIFTTLKSNQDEPDESRAIRVGVPSEEGIIENDIR